MIHGNTNERYLMHCKSMEMSHGENNLQLFPSLGIQSGVEEVVNVYQELQYSSYTQQWRPKKKKQGYA
jgi:hypothetical protein